MWVVGEFSFNRLVALIWSDNLYVLLCPFVLDTSDGGVGGVMHGGPGGFRCVCVTSDRGNQAGCMASIIHLLRLCPAWPSPSSGCMYSI